MRAVPAAAAVLLALAAPDARAAPEVALRLGVAPALGSAVDDVPMGDVVSVHLPVQLDALWREGPLAGGLYASWGPGRAGRCDAGASCGAAVTRAGLQATWTFATGGGPEAWGGVAAGYEWAAAERTRGTTVRTSLRGLEPLALQGGVEWRVHPRVALGPFGLLSLGRYARMTVDAGGRAADAAIADRAVHLWFHVGVRARVDLGRAR